MNKTKNSYSLINLMAINIGTMIGVGIFFKNQGILTTTNNIWIALIAWAVGSILVYGLALGFSEAASVTTKNKESGTLANWVRLFVGKKAGRFVHQLMSFQYYPIFSVMLAYYSVTFAYKAFEIENATLLTTLGLTIGSFAILALCNAMSYVFGKFFQMIGTVIKFIPLLAVMVLGFVNPSVASTANAFSGTIAGKAATWNWGVIILALPSVFFAFDGFFGGLALSKEESKTGDAVKATMLSVILVAIFYMTFASAVGWGTGEGDLFPLFSHTFKAKGAKFIYMVISVSAMTVANGMMLAGTRQLKNMSDDKEFLPIKLIQNTTKDGRFLGQTILIFIIGTFYAIVWVVGSKVFDVKLSALIDNFGNAVTLFAYFAYALVGFGVYKNRKTKTHNTTEVKGLWLIVTSSVIVMGLILYNTYNYLSNFKEDGITASLIILSLVVIYLCAKVTDISEKK